ncbi:N-acetylneuraminate lyase [Polypterus senegalus]|uniref:N-acetylneuraminate lyase n=1 Tax=Polypterus senegalus TaxID=55291 RepID=UPI001964D59F|nr:N-acetylneuraminate lyase [Polypterus senegalus]
MTSPVKQPLTGLIAATFTPLTPHGEVDVSVIGPYVDYLVNKQGIKHVFVNGSTGEGMSLSVDERKSLAAEWCRQSKNKLEQVIIHVGCLSVSDSKELARHAAEIGADGISIIAPSFFKPSSRDCLVQFLKEVTSAAPHLPFYYYHLPALTGVHIPAASVLDGIQKSIPSFQGLKFSDRDLLDFGLCVYKSPKSWPMLYGVDEQLLAGLALGAHGAIGSTYNYLGTTFNEMLDAFTKGDLAGAQITQFKVQEVFHFAMQHGFNLSLSKRVMCLLSGLPLGPPRLPLAPCSEEAARLFQAKIQDTLGLH